jgi:hypothetical protein
LGWSGEVSQFPTGQSGLNALMQPQLNCLKD